MYAYTSTSYNQLPGVVYTASRPIARPRWVPDECTAECLECGRGFTLFFRRHHCRICGNVVCSICSPNALFVNGYDGASRVCNNCFESEMGAIVGGEAPPRPAAALAREAREAREAAQAAAAAAEAAEAAAAAAAREQGGEWSTTGGGQPEQRLRQQQQQGQQKRKLRKQNQEPAAIVSDQRTGLFVDTGGRATAPASHTGPMPATTTSKNEPSLASTVRSTSPRQRSREKP